jgi:hypothetical protein
LRILPYGRCAAHEKDFPSVMRMLFVYPVPASTAPSPIDEASQADPEQEEIYSALQTPRAPIRSRSISKERKLSLRFVFGTSTRTARGSARFLQLHAKGSGTWVYVLDQMDSRWTSVFELAADGSDIEYIDFDHYFQEKFPQHHHRLELRQL